MITRRDILAASAAVGVLSGCVGESDNGGSGNEASSDEGDNDSGIIDGAEDDDDGDDEGDGGISGNGADENGHEDADDDVENASDDGDRSRDSIAEFFEDHPAVSDLAEQPILGDLTEASATVVDFSDPGCHVCRSFHRGTFYELEERLIESGDMAFVFRSYPVRGFATSVPGSQLLLSTHHHEPDAFWEFKTFLYDEQPDLSVENIYDESASFLEGRVDDPTTIVEDAREERFDEEIQTNVDAGEAAGAGGVTPVFYLFEDGSYLTEISGNQSYDVFASAFGL